VVLSGLLHCGFSLKNIIGKSRFGFYVMGSGAPVNRPQSNRTPVTYVSGLYTRPKKGTESTWPKRASRQLLCCTGTYECRVRAGARSGLRCPRTYRAPARPWICASLRITLPSHIRVGRHAGRNRDVQGRTSAAGDRRSRAAASVHIKRSPESLT
jgi:hypothetical protein